MVYDPIHHPPKLEKCMAKAAIALMASPVLPWDHGVAWGEALGCFAQELAPSGVRVGLEPQGLGDLATAQGGAGPSAFQLCNLVVVTVEVAAVLPHISTPMQFGSPGQLIPGWWFD